MITINVRIIMTVISIITVQSYDDGYGNEKDDNDNIMKIIRQRQ